MIPDLMPMYNLVTRWYHFSNALSQTLTDAEQTCGFIDQLKLMDDYFENTSQAERDYHDEVKAYCEDFIANMPTMGA